MICLREVTKRFGNTVAVDGLDLDVRRGEIFGLLGPNGAGKTTTVALIVGLLAPDGGRVDIGDGGDPRDRAVRRMLGLAPQALALYDTLTGIENLRFWGALFDLHGKALERRAAAALEAVALADRAGDRVATYSGGMKRRLNLAVALVHDPPILLCDEPTAGVDPQSRNAIFEALERLRADGRTILYTTHYMEEAERLCDRVAIIDSGRVLAVDSVDGLIATHGGPDRLVVESRTGPREIETDDPLATLNALAQQEDIVRFRVERPTLEAVFLRLTGRRLRD